MNRYLAVGVLGDLFAGKLVLVLTETRDGIRDAMDCVLHYGLPNVPEEELRDHLVVRWANGVESIKDKHGLGSIRFHSIRSSLRGLSPDVIVFDCDDHHLDGDWWTEFRHTVAIKAELIRR